MLPVTIIPQPFLGSPQLKQKDQRAITLEVGEVELFENTVDID